MTGIFDKATKDKSSVGCLFLIAVLADNEPYVIALVYCDSENFKEYFAEDEIPNCGASCSDLGMEFSAYDLDPGLYVAQISYMDHKCYDSYSGGWEYDHSYTVDVVYKAPCLLAEFSNSGQWGAWVEYSAQKIEPRKEEEEKADES